MVSVNKGAWDKAINFESVHAFNVQWIQECRRLLKPNGTLWVSGTRHNIYSVGYALQVLGFKILNDIAWYKVNPPPNLACRYFTHATETILWARRNEKARHTFNYEEMKQIGDPTPGKQMQSLWRIRPPAQWEKRHGTHPAQKPEALLDRIIRASTKPDDLVLDPFCGSGTTGVVANRLGRRFVGCEQEHEYLSLAACRLREEVPSVTMVLGCNINSTRSDTHKQVRNNEKWADVVISALLTIGGEGHLRDINTVVQHHPKTRASRTWVCTVRRVVRETPGIIALGHGRYRTHQ